MEFPFNEIFDIDTLRELCEGFAKLTNIPIALLDLKGNVHIGSGWQDICTKYHRVHKGMAARCRESDVYLANQSRKVDHYHVYKCKNGLQEVAIPISLKGEHVGNFFIGQFLYSSPDINYFKRQAVKFGINKDEYLEALSHVPIFSEEQVSKTVNFLVKLAKMVSESCLEKLQMKQAEEETKILLKKQQNADKQLTKLNQLLNFAFEASYTGPWWVELNKNQKNIIFHASNSTIKLFGVKLSASKKYEYSVWLNVMKKTSALSNEFKVLIEKSIQKFASIISGTIDYYEDSFPVVQPDSSIRWILAKASIIERTNDGLPSLIIGTVSDISQLHLAQEKLSEAKNEAEGALLKLRESESMLRTISDSAKDAILMMNSKGEITFWNPAATAIFGHSKEEALGKNLHRLLAPVKLHKNFQDAFPEFLKTGKGAAVGKTLELPAIRKGGDEIVVELSLSSILIKNSWNAVAIIRDITERKKAEASILMDQRVKSIGEVSAGIAHDFNNTLQRIITGAETILFNSQLPQNAMKTISTIKESAELSAERIKKLLLFTGHTKSGKQIFELNEIIVFTIDQIKLLLEKQYYNNQKIIHISYDPIQNIYIKGVKGELQDVFFNLFKNSIEAMPDGGNIRVDINNLSEAVVITVADSGVGMDSETAERVFQHFFTTKEIGVGTGVGLSGAYGTIKNMNGNICIKTTAIGKGTVFEISLPKAEEGYLGTVDKPQGHHSAIRAKILWVDDDKDIREMGIELLKILGHNAFCAGSGKEALKKLDKEEYDLIITDISMPEMNGCELVKRITKQLPKMKIAILSGGSSNYSPDELKSMGISCAIQKPVTKTALQKHIQYIFTENA